MYNYENVKNNQRLSMNNQAIIEKFKFWLIWLKLLLVQWDIRNWRIIRCKIINVILSMQWKRCSKECSCKI